MDWGTLLSTFGLVFIAELGDKTQLAVVTQTCKYRRPWAVFLGASLALTGVTAIGAVGGQVLGQIVPAEALRAVAALAFAVMGVLVGREALKTASGSLAAECPLVEETSAAGAMCRSWDWTAFGSTLGLLFVAELGDKTQLAVFSLAGRYGTPWVVFAGGALALTLVTALGVVGGEGLCRIIPERVLLWVSALAFAAMGLLMGLGIV
ncbi:MAG: TMEM165/GDT1 family protein [Anaerolineae bacterium]|nr:TMEM165/GDT1 family protein [Anaerolineae bacterium]